MDPEQQNKLEKDKRSRLIIFLALGLTGALIVGVIVYKAKGGEGGSSDSVSGAAMIPIWVAIFIPLIAIKKKKEKEGQKREPLTEQKKKFLLYALLFIGLMVLATILTLYFKT